MSLQRTRTRKWRKKRKATVVNGACLLVCVPTYVAVVPDAVAPDTDVGKRKIFYFQKRDARY